jgi:hypothetical protein
MSNNNIGYIHLKWHKPLNKLLDNLKNKELDNYRGVIDQCFKFTPVESLVDFGKGTEDVDMLYVRICYKFSTL